MPRVLLDDDVGNVTVLRLLLELDGFHVETAADGVAALDRLAGEGFDVVVTDLTMPHRDGYGFIRAAKATTPVPVVVMSARIEAAARGAQPPGEHP